MPYDFDVQGAISKGYTPTQIADYLASKTGFDIAGARKAGYGDDAIVGYLSPPAPPPPPEKGVFDIATDPQGGILPAIGKAFTNILPSRDNQQDEGTIARVAKDTAASVFTGALNIGPAALGFLDWASGGAVDTASRALTGTPITQTLAQGKQIEEYGMPGTSFRGAKSQVLAGKMQELNKIMEDEKSGGILPSIGMVLSNPDVALAMLGDTFGVSVAAGGITNLLANAPRMGLAAIEGGNIAGTKAATLAWMAGDAAKLRAAGAPVAEITAALQKRATIFAGNANLAVNFAMEAGDTANATMLSVMQKSPAELEKTSDTYRKYLADGMSQSDAQFKTAQDAKRLAGLVGGAIGALSTKLTGGGIDLKLFGGKALGGFKPGEGFKSVGKEFAEEFGQGFGDQFGQDVAEKTYVDPNTSLVSNKTWAQAGVGGLIGAAFGGAGHAYGRLTNPADEVSPPSPPKATPAPTVSTPVQAGEAVLQAAPPGVPFSEAVDASITAAIAVTEVPSAAPVVDAPFTPVITEIPGAGFLQAPPVGLLDTPLAAQPIASTQPTTSQEVALATPAQAQQDQMSEVQPPAQPTEAVPGVVNGKPQEIPAPAELKTPESLNRQPAPVMTAVPPGRRIVKGQWRGEYHANGEYIGDLHQVSPDEWRILSVNDSRVSAESGPLNRGDFKETGSYAVSGSQRVPKYGPATPLPEPGAPGAVIQPAQQPVAGEAKNAEQPGIPPVAESQAPAPSEPGDGGVAPTQESTGPQALMAQYEAAKAAGNTKEVQRLAHEINQAKLKEAEKATKTPIKFPDLPYGKVGVMPKTADVVGLKDNGDGKVTVMRGAEPFYDYETGDPVTVAAGATPEQVHQAIIDAKALSAKDKWFGVKNAQSWNVDTQNGNDIRDSQTANETAAKAPDTTTQAEAPANPVSMTAADWHKQHTEWMVKRFEFKPEDAEVARKEPIAWDKHQDFLETALEDGKEIPQNVLDDYAKNDIKPDPKEWPLLAKKLAGGQPQASELPAEQPEPEKTEAEPDQSGAKLADGTPIKVGDTIEYKTYYDKQTYRKRIQVWDFDTKTWKFKVVDVPKATKDYYTSFGSVAALDNEGRTIQLTRGVLDKEDSIIGFDDVKRVTTQATTQSQEQASAKKPDAAKDDAKAAKKQEAARRQAEKDLFTAMAGDAAVIEAADIKAEGAKKVDAWLTAEIEKETDDNRKRALEAIKGEGMPESFYEGLAKEAKQQQKAKEQAALVEKSKTALLAAITTDNILGDTGKRMFVEGWDHALAGKTKSTLPGDEIRSKGYEAARKWLSTPEGRLAQSGKRGKKLENTGADLRRWFDEQKAKVTDGDTESVMAALDNATARAELFRNVLTESSTPGAQRWLEGFRNRVLPFKRWLTEKGSLSVGLYGRLNISRRGASDTDKIRAYLDSKMYLANEGEDESRESRIKRLKDAADEYVTMVALLTDKLEGENVKALAESLPGAIFKAGITNPSFYNADHFTESGKQVAGLLLDGRRDLRTYGTLDSYTVRILIQNEAQTIEASRKAALTPPRLDRVDRDGEDFRKGKNVTPADFKQTFDFADVGFGKWVGAKQDQDHLNYSYDAFRDLAKLLGLPTEAISLGGRLHFTIGALGHGKFAAHYTNAQPHPDGGTVPVINVTNTRGDGTVAHEWSHALDLTSQSVTSQGENPELKGAIAEIKRDLEYAYNFDKLRASVVSMLKGSSYWGGAKANSKTDEGKVSNAQRAIDYYAARSRQESNYYSEAIKLDGSKANTDPYWSNDKELFARAFEGWTGDKMETANTYLVNPAWSGEGNVTSKTHRGTPYPMGEERERFNKWLDALAQSLVFDKNKKVVVLDPDKWAQNRPKYPEEWKQTLADLKDQLPAMLEALKREQKAKAEEHEIAVAHSLTMRVGDMVLARGQSMLNRYPEPVRIEAVQKMKEGGVDITFTASNGATQRYNGSLFEIVKSAAEAEAETQKAVEEVRQEAPPGELSEDDLSALFDEAAAELQEQTQEQPDAPAPGEPMQTTLDGTLTREDAQHFLTHVERGSMILFSGTAWAKAENMPTIHDIASLAGTGARVDHLGFGVFKVVGPNFEGSFEGGGAMSESPGGQPYSVLTVSSGEFKNYPFTRVKAVLSGLVKPVNILIPKSQREETARVDTTAAQLAAEAAKLGVKGVDEAMKGLVKLFGGGPNKLMSFPGGMDEETYKAAKPHFEAALKAFQDAGKTIKELFKFLIENFGAGVKPYAIHFAKEMNLTAGLGQQTSATAKVAGYIKGKLDAAQEVRWQELFDEADKAWNGSQAAGTYTVKDAYDAMEMGVNLYLRSKGLKSDATAEAATSVVNRLTALIGKLPTQTKRTAEQDEYQQFSTPPALAYVASWVSKVGPNDTLMEPSAGTGDLAIYADNAGAALILNELSSRRAAILKELFPAARIFTENAEQLNNILPADAVPSVVVMNPPFSSTAGRVQGSRDTMNGAKHIEQALKRLAKGGRLVAIVGEGMAADKAAFKSWWKTLQESYNVRANIGISGKEYAKYGTTFDNQILVIDKDGPTKAQVVTGKVESIAELPALLEEIRNDRPTVSERLGTQPESSTTTQTDRANAGQEDATGGSAVDALGADGEQTGAGADLGDGAELQRPASGLGGSDTGSGKPQSQTADGVPDKDGQRRPGTGGSGQPGTGRGSGNAAGGTDTSSPGAAGEVGGVTVGAQDQQKAEGELTNSVFENYKPQRLSVPGAKEHPGALVQSAAMASVEPPAPTYTPNLPKEVIDKGLLSLAQIESIVYAGQAHEQFLPNGERRGFFIGDGTGVGKGREISGIIMDSMRRGQKKAVWVSANEGLLSDAQRDYKGIGGDKNLLFFQGKTKPANDITAKSGILFTSYSTLKSAEKKQANDTGQKQGRTRLDQIVKWVGEDYDGVIVFDEAHSMGNLVATKGKRGKKKPAQQAIAGANLQRMLPKARIVYVSATGATEINNLAYSARLGLWGEGTAFAGVTEFIAQVTQGGVAAMELISRDMKALGMYIARSLSFDGVTYQRLEHELTPLQTDIYNKLAVTWQGVLKNVNAALGITNGAKNGNAKSAAMSAFWGSHQRFFNQVITSLQTPTVIEDMKKQIADGNSVLLQLVNTNEATQEREVAKAQAEGVDFEELDFTPRQMLMDYVRNSFPVQAYEETVDANGNIIYTPVVDKDGNPVFDKEAIAMREALLKELEQIRVPENPIDAIIQAFGSEKVGEVTGRKRRFIQQRDEDGSIKVVEEKRGKHASHNDAEAFQGDKKPILIFSAAGGTGYSFHADNTAKNQRKRIHYILQPGWRADGAVQGFGRSHRTNQKQPPHYVLPATNLKAQKRFVSSIARRLDQLGALTRGQRQATGQGLFGAADNLESKYAEDALEVLFNDMYRGATSLDFHEITQAMGLTNLIDPRTGAFAQGNVPEIPQFLNRLLSLQSHQQDEVFAEFEQRLTEVVEFAIQQGTYDNGMQTLKAQSINKVRDDIAHTDERTGAQTRYVEIDVTNPIKYRPWDKAIEHADSYGAKFAGWFKSAKGSMFGIVNMGTRVNAKGEEVQRGLVFDIRGDRQRYIDNADELIQGYRIETGAFGKRTRKELSTKIDDVAAAQAEWEKQVDDAPKTETKRDHLIVGVILPIWDRVKGHPRIYRLQTDAGERMIGRMISAKDVPATLKNLGLGSTVSKMSPADVLQQIQQGRKAILANGWEIFQVIVSGDKRLEVSTSGGFYGGDRSVLEDMGLFFERIAWRDRAFIATGDRGLEVFERLVKSKPVVELVGGKEQGASFSRGSTSPAAHRIPGEHTDKTNRLEKEIRADLRRSGSEAPAEGAHFIRQVGVPYSAKRITKAVEKLFGVRVTFVQVDDPKGDIFNGAFLGGNQLFVKVGSNRPYSTIIGHEFLHYLKEANPGVYAELEKSVHGLTTVKKFAAAAEKHQPARNAGEEVIADTFGDHWSDPTFWEELSVRVNPSIFLRIRQAFTRFLGRLIDELKAMGSTTLTDSLYGDLKVVRDVILNATVSAAQGRKLATPIWNRLHARFSNESFGAVDTNSPEFKKWFGDSKVVEPIDPKVRQMAREYEGRLFGGAYHVSRLGRAEKDAAIRKIIPAAQEQYNNIRREIGLPIITDWNISPDVLVSEYKGKPLVVYHSTDKTFNKISFKNAGQRIFWFTSNQTAAEAGEVGAAGRGKIMELYASIKNPASWKEYENLGLSELELRGYDGAILNDPDGTFSGFIFEPTQIKSAISNTGEFSATNPDIRFSRNPTLARALDTLDNFTGKSDHTFGNLKNVQTQLHKARLDPKHFGRVFNLAMDFRTDLARSAYRSAALAKDILPAFDNVTSAVKALIHGNKASKELASVSKLIFDGTTFGGGSPYTGKRWTETQLRDNFDASTEEIKLYQQAREAIDASLKEVANSVAWQIAKPFVGKATKQDVIDNPEGAKDILLEAMGLVQQAASAEDKPSIKAAIKTIKDTFKKAQELSNAGYAPLTRFGRYTVDVYEVDEDGNVAKDENGVPIRLEFQKFEFESEAKAEARRLRKEYADQENVVVETGIQADEKLFSGVDPETVTLFAEQVADIPGLDINRAVLDKWRREALSQRSALMHHIKRKGIEGYSNDLPRVLATFITSNARYASSNFHMADMLEAINEIPKTKGDVRDEAKHLYDYINSSNEPGAWMRGLMFAWYLGGSPAAAMVNLTQPVLMSLPYLSQFGGATRHLMSSVKQAWNQSLIPPHLQIALSRAREEGIVEANEIHHLYDEGMKPVIARLPGGESLRARAQGASTLWGAFFGKAEDFNRRITFLAAYKMAQEMGDSKLKAKGFSDAYDFSKRAVEETQGIYAKENRPNWARGTGTFGAVGVAAFTFKQFSIQYVELLSRMARSGPEGKKAALLMLGLLILASGLQGIPGADDLDDVIDTVLQSMGYRGNFKKAKRDALKQLAGERIADIVMYGLSSETPIDVQSRLGLGNLIPATGIFKPSEPNKASQIAEILGPPGGLAKSAGDFIDSMQSGQHGSAFAALSPVFIRNIVKAVQMGETGQYKDARGRNVEKVDMADSIIKGIGFQPQNVASSSRKAQLIRQDITQVRGVEADIAAIWALGVSENDKAEVQRAKQMLKDWNETNPETPIVIKPGQILRRVQEIRKERNTRLEKTAPKEMRRHVNEAIH